MNNDLVVDSQFRFLTTTLIRGGVSEREKDTTLHDPNLILTICVCHVSGTVGRNDSMNRIIVVSSLRYLRDRPGPKVRWKQ